MYSVLNRTVYANTSENQPLTLTTDSQALSPSTPPHQNYQQQQQLYQQQLFGNDDEIIPISDQMNQGMQSYHTQAAVNLSGYHSLSATVNNGSAIELLQPNQVLSHQTPNQSFSRINGGFYIDYNTLVTSQQLHPYLNNGQSHFSERGEYHQLAQYNEAESPNSDILDLDSQKLVYSSQPENEVAAAVQYPIIWSQELYSAGPPAHHKPLGITNFATVNTPVSANPSNYPIAVTPQDNIMQYRIVESPALSLPSSTSSTKSVTRRSNKGRGTFKCTTCNSWFTSACHLRRHYKTMLHKTNVESSGQPDPYPLTDHHNKTPSKNQQQPESEAVLNDSNSSLINDYEEQIIIHPIHHQHHHEPTTILLSKTATTNNQEQQRPIVDQQQHYQTIIDNETQLTQLKNFMDMTSLTSSSETSTQQNNHMQQQIVAQEINGQIVQLKDEPFKIDVQLFSNGLPMYSTNLLQTSPPSIEESYSSPMLIFDSHTSSKEFDNTTSVSEQDQPTNKRQRKVASSQNNVTKFKCDECKKEFTRICYLTQHNNTFHSGELPYKCQKCGKRFRKEEIFTAHLKRHESNDKPHKCDICPKQFFHKTDLRRHKEGSHAAVRAHICGLCNKGFCRMDHLRKHLEMHARPRPVRRKQSIKTEESEISNDSTDL